MPALGAFLWWLKRSGGNELFFSLHALQSHLQMVPGT
jgi:hypothetical protein